MLVYAVPVVCYLPNVDLLYVTSLMPAAKVLERRSLDLAQTRRSPRHAAGTRPRVSQESGDYGAMVS